MSIFKHLSFFIISAVISFPSPVYSGNSNPSPVSEPEKPAKSNGLEIFTKTGIGYANNLTLAAYMDRYAEEAELLWHVAENKSARKEPVLYGGIEIEVRKPSGNLGYGLSCGYFRVNDGHREVYSSLGYYKNHIELSFITLLTSVFYKFPVKNSSFLVVYGGIGYYRGTLKNDQGIYYYVTSDIITRSEDISWTIGVHSGLEYNKQVFDSFIISTGILSRFAEVFHFDMDVNNNTESDIISAGLTGIYLYAAAGYQL